MSVRATVNQVVQIGPETTAGTPVPAGKLITGWTWTLGSKNTTKQFTSTGRKYPTSSALLTEMAAIKASGEGDFAQLAYVLSSVFGKTTPTLHSPSTSAYDWTFTPPVAGVSNPQTFTIQQGDTNDAEQYAYAIFSGFGYTFGRKQEVQISADGFAQTLTDGATLTASPTAIEKLPMTGAQMSVYLDTTSAGIGTTKLTDPLKVDFKASDFYDSYWPINRSTASFTSHLDKLPKNELKLTLQANSTGIAVRSNYLQTGSLAYVRVSGVGATIDSGNSVSASFTHDMACFVSSMAEFSDVDGVFAVEYSLTVAEDAAWNSGQAQKLTLTNLLSAL